VATVGERIRELRAERRLTLEQLAARCGISKGFLSDVENDKRGLSRDSLLRVAQALGASVDYILRGDEPETPFSAPVVIPHELAAFAEQEGLSYAKTVELLAAHNSVVARRSKEGTQTLSVDGWRRLLEAIKDIFG
jgi:transcriptional regulator with XRE-family HTH domain